MSTDLYNFVETTWARLVGIIMDYDDVYYPTVLPRVHIPLWLQHHAQSIEYLTVSLNEYDVAFRVKMCRSIVSDVDPDEFVSSFEIMLVEERRNREKRTLESTFVAWNCTPPESYFGC